MSDASNQLTPLPVSGSPLDSQAALAGNGNGTNELHRTTWEQKALAQCYFHTRMPRLVRPIRERYHLTRSANGRWPKFQKRSVPTARILYYHRINDDCDVFFPAMSTQLFEQEMRFIASHYKVVSLDKLADHLDNGSSETLLTVTFDDGYRDNFQNAFPILQRYGLPGTIFLTTGGLDTGEPLWFEQLALALKTTAKEILDIETNPPRRFRIRTQAERLSCNSWIQGFVRDLPDSERKQWVAQILGQLRVQGHGERKDKMLTWEQVRFMKKRGIDFGGHTVTHPFLSKTTREQGTWEISACKARIEEELQLPVHYFAYPNGHEPDMSKWNQELVRSAGYRAAVSTIWGVNDPSTDRMELRRSGPWEASQALFAYKLDWYQLTNE